MCPAHFLDRFLAPNLEKGPQKHRTSPPNREKTANGPKMAPCSQTVVHYSALLCALQCHRGAQQPDRCARRFNRCAQQRHGGAQISRRRAQQCHRCAQIFGGCAQQFHRCAQIPHRGAQISRRCAEISAVARRFAADVGAADGGKFSNGWNSAARWVPAIGGARGGVMQRLEGRLVRVCRQGVAGCRRAAWRGWLRRLVRLSFSGAFPEW